MNDFLLRGEEEIPVQPSYGGAKPMNLKLPKKNTFWAAVIIAAVGLVVYAVYLVAELLFRMQIPGLHPVSFLLVIVAFVMLCLGLTQKDL